MIKEIGWSVDDKNIPLSFFKDNYDSFKNMAGDVETLIFNCKIEHSKRVFCLPEQRKKLNYDDIRKGFEVFCKSRGNKKETNDEGSENNLGYVFAVFAIVWGLFFAFMILLMRKQTRINSEISYLKQLLETKKTPE